MLRADPSSEKPRSFPAAALSLCFRGSARYTATIVSLIRRSPLAGPLETEQTLSKTGTPHDRDRAPRNAPCAPAEWPAIMAAYRPEPDLTCTPPSSEMFRYINLQPGDPAPWFHQRSISNPRYV